MPIMERYEEEFNEISSQIQSTLDKLNPVHQNSSDEESASHHKNHNIESDKNLVKNLLSQNKDLLKQMAIEARSISKQSKSSDDVDEAKILRVCKAKHANLTDDVERVIADLNRSFLLASGKNEKMSNVRNKHDGTKEKLLHATNSLNSQNQSLDNARKVLLDTEHTALEITEELSRNREKISSAHSRVRDVGTMTNRARRVLHNMTRRDVQQKMIVYCIGAVLAMVVLYLLFGGLFL